jgi:hypothetical protein
MVVVQASNALFVGGGRRVDQELVGHGPVDIRDIEACETDDQLRVAIYRDIIQRSPAAETDLKDLIEAIEGRRGGGVPAPGS